MMSMSAQSGGETRLPHLFLYKFISFYIKSSFYPLTCIIYHDILNTEHKKRGNTNEKTITNAGQ